MKRNFCLSFALFALFGATHTYLTNASNMDVLITQNTQQTKKITGKVVDTTGEPIIGASILVKGTNTGTITNMDGNFSIDAAVGNTLQISFVGYQTLEVKVTSASTYNIALQDSAEELSEIVVTAMGIRKDKKALGYTVSDINSEELMKNKQTNVINSLAGKIPGVNVTQAGGAAGAGANIIIRGGNSASEGRDNQPLFIVDGIVYENLTLNTGHSGTGGVT